MPDNVPRVTAPFDAAARRVQNQIRPCITRRRHSNMRSILSIVFGKCDTRTRVVINDQPVFRCNTNNCYYFIGINDATAVSGLQHGQRSLSRLSALLRRFYRHYMRTRQAHIKLWPDTVYTVPCIGWNPTHDRQTIVGSAARCEITTSRTHRNCLAVAPATGNRKNRRRRLSGRIISITRNSWSCARAGGFKNW